MPIQMVFHEGRDEIIAVVVSGAQAKLEPDASALAGALKKLGAQLFFKKTVGFARSEEHTSELQSLMRTSYAVFCLKPTKNEEHDTRTLRTEQKNTPYLIPTTQESQ